MRGASQGDSSILDLISKVSDVIILNFMILLGCLPIVTIGASLTAGHFAALRIRRGEGSVWADFCRSFKENFKQATIIWLLFLTVIVCAFALLWFFGKQSVGVSILSVLLFILVFVLSLWVFPVLSKFVNTTGNIVRNGAILCVRYFFRTLAMIIGTMMPVILLVASIYALPLVLLCGGSLPIYISAMLYDKVFFTLEEDVRNSNAKKTG